MLMNHLIKKIISKAYFLSPALSGLILIALSGVSYAELTAIETRKVITITPAQLPNINGRVLNFYSVAAVKENRFTPIPYQFDEMSEDRFVFIEGEKSVALKMEGVASKLKGKPNFFDEDDQLIFMLRDAGPKRKSDTYSDGEVYAEIEITTRDNQKRYVYVVGDARNEFDNYYVRYSSEIGRAETEFYSLKVNPKNALVWDEFYFESFDGAHERQPIDTMKLGFRANVVPAAMIPVYLNNKNLKAKALTEKSGPIRATTTYRQTLKYLGAPWFVSKTQIQHFESKVQYDFILRMPEARRQMLANPKIRISTDGWDLNGADIVLSSAPDIIGKVDGKVSEEEKKAADIRPELSAKNWIWLDSHYHYSSLTTYTLRQDTSVDSKLNKPKLEFRFKDNNEKKDKPEFHRGQSPDLGFVAKMPQFGHIHLTYTIDMFSADLGLQGKEVAAQVHAEPNIKITTLK